MLPLVRLWIRPEHELHLLKRWLPSLSLFLSSLWSRQQIRCIKGWRASEVVNDSILSDLQTLKDAGSGNLDLCSQFRLAFTKVHPVDHFLIDRLQPVNIEQFLMLYITAVSHDLLARHCRVIQWSTPVRRWLSMQDRIVDGEVCC